MQTCQSAHKEELQLMQLQPCTQTMPSLWEEVCRLWQDRHYREVCRSRSTTIDNIEQVPNQCKEEDHIDMMNINSIIFNNKCFAIKANLKTSSNQVSIVISYKVNMGSDGNIKSLHLCCIYCITGTAH